MSILAHPRRSLENPNVPISPYQLADIMGGGPTRAGVQVNEHTAITYLAVYTAVKVIAESLGNLPLGVFRQTDADAMEQVRPGGNDAGGAEAFALMIEANDEQSPSFFKETLQAWQSLWGNGYARIISGRRSLQLVPLRSDRCHPERKAGRLMYRVESDGAATTETFDPSEILHLPGLSMNGVSGLSPIGIAREAIAAGKAGEIFASTFFGNGTNIGGILSHPGRLKPETKSAMRQSWNNAYQGVANANRVAILDEGVKFERLGMNLDDAQFLESRKFQIVEIARLYRVPPHMLMDLDQSTNNNIEQQSLEFVMFCLSPWLTKWEEEFTRKLFGGAAGGLMVKFDLKKLLMADMNARQAYYAAGRQWGYLSQNDVRRMEGLNPILGGDVYLSPQNMVPTDKAHPLIDSQIAKNLAPVQPPATTDNSDGESPAKEPGQQSDALAARLFTGVFKRMVRKECNAARRGNAALGERFYAEHRSHMMNDLIEVAEAIGQNATSETIKAFCDEACANSPLRKDSSAADEHERNYPAWAASELARRMFGAK